MNLDDASAKRDQLEAAIAAQEGLRGTLSDEIIDATIGALRKQLANLAPKEAIEQQRKMVTILFMDIVESTRLLGELDPEENMAIMDAALERLAGPIEEFDGQVTRFMGDGYLAVFGLVRAQENDPEKAVRAGLRVIETAGQIARELETGHQLPGFQVRVGINTGLVVAGGITEAEGTIMGAAVNLAARLEAAAPAGGVLISQDTYSQIDRLFEVDKFKPVQAKGFEAPVHAYQVIRPRPREFHSTPRRVEGIETRMVGRQSEFESLIKAFHSGLEDQTCKMVLVVGEAGVGKSRLLEEFERWLDKQPQNVELFKGRANPESKNLPHALIRDIFAFRYEVLDDDPVQIVRNKIVAGLRDDLIQVENLEMKAHFIGELLGYDFEDSPHVRGVKDNPRHVYDRGMIYLGEYFKRVCEKSPLAIFLDDAHWADESSLDVLAYIQKHLARYPALIVALGRPSLSAQGAAWSARFQSNRLTLQPLQDQDSQALVEDVLQMVENIPDDFRDLIVRNAEGNPFYIEELIKMLIDDGVIEKSSERWKVFPNKLESIRIPPTLTGVIQSRLESLSKDERKVIQQASIVGRVFWDEAVNYLNRGPLEKTFPEPGANIDCQPYLDRLANSEMITHQETSVFSSAEEYLFGHAVLREVTYESVLLRDRRIYHSLVADWLSSLSGDRSTEVNGLIARHLEKASRDSEAVVYLLRAGEAALANSGFTEAADFYERALNLTPEDNLHTRYSIYLGQEAVCANQGRRDEQRQVLATLIEIAAGLDDPLKQAEVWIRSAWLSFWTSDFRGMLAAGERAAVLLGPFDAPRLEGEAYYVRAWGALQLEDPEGAQAHAHEALKIARRSGDLRLTGNVHNILGLISIARANFYGARTHLVEFLALARKMGDMEREYTALLNLGAALTPLGDYSGAIDYLQHSMEIVRELKNSLMESTVLVNLAWVAISAGDWENGRKYAEMALPMKRKFGHLEALGECLLWLGHAWVGLGNVDKAVSLYRESRAIRRKVGQVALEMGVVAALARAEVARGDLAASQGYVDEVMEYLEHGGDFTGTWEPIRLYNSCYQTLKLSGDPRAYPILETAHNILQRQAGLIPAGPERQRFLEVVPWNLAIKKEWENQTG